MEKKYNRLYKDLAWLWPLWGTVEEYRKECELFTKLIKKHSQIDTKTLLDIGCGGGKNAFNFKKDFTVTGIDVSEEMLNNARQINPECEFVIADMRDFELNREFDSIFLNDSIMYMKSPGELESVFRRSFDHLKSGGVMICYAEILKENFKQNETWVTTSQNGDLEITFIENNYDKNPNDDVFESVMIYLIRKKGDLRIEEDYHECGIFTIDVWRNALKNAGFDYLESAMKDRQTDIPLFICTKKSEQA